jgi:hypothetical protein
MSESTGNRVDERAAVGIADGSLRGEARARAQAQLDATAPGRRALEEQQRVVSVLRAAAPVVPPGLRAAIRAQSARPRRVRLRLDRRPARVGGVAAALAAVALLGGVLAINPAHRSDQSTGSGSRGVTVMAALAFGSRPATASAPPPLAIRPQLLARAVEGVVFPNWARAREIAPAHMPHTGWKPVGARGDRLDGRRADTVYYQHMTHRVAYTIIAGAALTPPPHAHRIVVAGRPLWTLRDGDRDVVVFTRHGKTCVLAGHVVSPHTLWRLATWRGNGSVTF